jgi:hypothetical protein
LALQKNLWVRSGIGSSLTNSFEEPIFILCCSNTDEAVFYCQFFSVCTKSRQIF